MFFLENIGAKQAKQVQAEQKNDNAANACKPSLIIIEKPPYGSKTKTQQKESETDAKDEKKVLRMTRLLL